MAAAAATTTTTLVVMIYSVFLFIFLLNPSFSAAQSDSILYSGESLSTGASLSYGVYTFTMQEDCNLVLYDAGSAIWSSNTYGLASNCYCSMQSDGNLVVYKPDGSPLWASNTDREQGNYVLILQKDRNVVIYGGAIWASNTYTSSFNSKRGGGTMNVVSITNLPAPIIYSDGAKNVTGRITTRAGRVA